MKALFIDNFGLSTYNLAVEFEKNGCEVLVYGNDADMKIINGVIKKFKPKLIVITPGPEHDSGNSADVVRAYQGQIPIFGIGIGCIIKAFEGRMNKSAANHDRIVKISHVG